VAAYDRIAAVYGNLSEERRAYLSAVERLAIAGIPSGSQSLLDVGAGDGTRGRRIAAAAGMKSVTLLEPSAAMRAHHPGDVRTWALRAEDLGSQEGVFDAIVCLWNVLGHIFPASARAEVLRQCGRLAAPGGRIFVDLSHRYNARHYGYTATAGRFLRDRFSAPGSHGDVQVVWRLGGEACATTGHVFTHAEFAALCGEAGLAIEKRYAIDYASGAICRRSFQGNLMYVLRR
jgi:2-polyprenyl-3-methyl-5-hydroxy-6-metoxy-1,4-benzoquinol methylase